MTTDRPSAGVETRTFLGWLQAVWRTWRGRTALSVLDQGLLSGATFLSNVLLARYLEPSEYGAFASSVSVSLFFYGLYNSVLIEPLSVLGSTRYRDSLFGYLSRMLQAHWLLALPLSALLFALASFNWLSALAILPATALMLPFMLLTQMLRAVCYMRARPDLAVRGSGAFFLTLTSSVVLLRTSQRLSPQTAMLAFALAQAAAGLAMRIGVASAPRNAEVAPSWADITTQHWAFGRPILVAGVVGSAAGPLYLPLVAASVNTAQAAALRSLQLLVTPCQQLMTAITTLALPRLAQQNAQRGPSYLRRARVGFLLVLFTLAVAYAAAVLCVGQAGLTWLFGPYYGAFAWGTLALALFLPAQAAAAGFGVLLRVQQRPAGLMAAKFATFVVTFSVCLPWIRHQGLVGAVWALPMVALVEALVCGAFLLRARARRSDPTDGSSGSSSDPAV